MLIDNHLGVLEKVIIAPGSSLAWKFGTLVAKLEKLKLELVAELQSLEPGTPEHILIQSLLGELSSRDSASKGVEREFVVFNRQEFKDAIKRYKESADKKGTTDVWKEIFAQIGFELERIMKGTLPL